MLSIFLSKWNNFMRNSWFKLSIKIIFNICQGDKGINQVYIVLHQVYVTVSVTSQNANLDKNIRKLIPTGQDKETGILKYLNN